MCPGIRCLCLLAAASPFTLGSTRLKVRKEVEEEEKSVSREEAGHDNLDVRWRAYRGVLNEFGGSEAIFWHLFAHIAAADTFWLDRYDKIPTHFYKSAKDCLPDRDRGGN